MNNRYWENGSGYYDPTAKAALEKNSERDRLVRETIYEIKQILSSRNLRLLNRMIIKDEKTEEVYK